MIEVTCNYCGRDDYELVTQGADFLLDRPGDFRLVRCRHCDLIYQNPRPTLDELLQYYPNDYQPYQRALQERSSRVQRIDRRHEMTRRFKHIQRYLPRTGHMLEVGSSTGQFLVDMRERGWTVTGVEISAFAAEYARENLGLDIITGTLETADLPSNHFDLVTLWDVFEHVIDPQSTLAEIQRVLKPGGYFIASVPNPACIEARLFGDYWVGWDRPRHLHLFTPTVLENYLHDAGMELETIKSFSGRLGVTLMSVEFWAKARKIPQEKWGRWTKLAYSLPLRLITWPLYRIAGAFNQTSIMTIFARLPASQGDSAHE
jgi:SAM-dependent methyltransferase